MKKNKKIIIALIIILTIVILGIIGCLIYFTTDIFKGNKELFFKYITQTSDLEKGFIEKNVKEYYSKKENNSYTNEGNFKVTAQNPDVTNLDTINNFSISFTGKNDNSNSKSEQNISINYSDSVTFPINYKKIGNQIGLQTDYVGAKYINIETDKIDKLSEIEKAKNIQDIGKIVSIIEQTKNISIAQGNLTTYFNIIQNLGEEKFSKLSDANGTGYQLLLNGEDLKNLLVQILETLKSDENTLDIINQYIKQIRNSANITQSSINELIENIQNSSQVSNENFSVTVYKKSGKTSKIVISLNEIKIDIHKNTNNENAQYEILIDSNYNNENLKITGKMNYEGLQNQNVKETYEIGLESGAKIYNYKLENNIAFGEGISIEDFTTDNSMVLTNYENEAVNNFLVAVEERIIEVNKQQMQELGVEEDQNSLLRLIPDLGSYTNLINSFNKPEVSKEDVATFNNKFEVYQSTNLQGVTVKGLLSTIQLNNEQQDETRQIKEINFNGEEYEVNGQNIAAIKEEVVAENYYRVEFERDQETGLIYRAVINPK